MFEKVEKSDVALILIKDGSHEQYVLLHIEVALKTRIKTALSILNGDPVFKPEINKINLKFNSIGFNISSFAKLVNTDDWEFDDYFTSDDEVVFFDRNEIENSMFEKSLINSEEINMEINNSCLTISVVNFNGYFSESEPLDLSNFIQ